MGFSLGGVFNSSLGKSLLPIAGAALGGAVGGAPGMVAGSVVGGGLAGGPEGAVGAGIGSLYGVALGGKAFPGGEEGGFLNSPLFGEDDTSGIAGLFPGLKGISTGQILSAGLGGLGGYSLLTATSDEPSGMGGGGSRSSPPPVGETLFDTNRTLNTNIDPLGMSEQEFFL